MALCCVLSTEEHFNCFFFYSVVHKSDRVDCIFFISALKHAEQDGGAA